MSAASAAARAAAGKRASTRAERRGHAPHADRVFFLNPDLRRVASVGPLPPLRERRCSSASCRSPRRTETELVVAHAPTNRAIKGTDHVIRAVEAASRRGVERPARPDRGRDRRRRGPRAGSPQRTSSSTSFGSAGTAASPSRRMALGRPVLCLIREDDPADNPLRIGASDRPHEPGDAGRRHPGARQIPIAGARSGRRRGDSSRPGTTRAWSPGKPWKASSISAQTQENRS